MNVTNKYNLPDAVVRAITYDDYDAAGDMSVTGLLQPVQQAALMSIYAGDLPPEDVSEHVWRMFGSVAHEVLYRSRDPESVVAETRLHMQVGGWDITGKPDVYDVRTRTLTDFKTTSVWSLIYEPAGRKEWHQQLNLYRLLLEANGYPVESLQIIAILRDHQKRETFKRSDYPQIPIVAIDIPLWDKADAEAFLDERVRLHRRARDDGDWEACTDEERWKGKSGYARCEGYCQVATLCPQLARERNHH